jgi:hypothetical protein
MKASVHSILVIAKKEQLPQPLPSEIRVVDSLVQAKSEKILLRGEAYVIFRKYIGMKPTGPNSWFVSSFEGDHQPIISKHQKLIDAIQSAKEANGTDFDALQK